MQERLKFEERRKQGDWSKKLGDIIGDVTQNFDGAFSTERLSKEERGGRHGKPPWGNRGKEEGPAELQGKGKKSRQGKTSNHRAAMKRKQETGTKAKQAKTEGQGTGSNGGKMQMK